GEDTRRGLRGESTEAQADRRGLRLAQDHWSDAANAPPRPAARRLDVRVQLGGLQPGADQESGGTPRVTSHRRTRTSSSRRLRQAPPDSTASGTSRAVLSWPVVCFSRAFSAAC